MSVGLAWLLLCASAGVATGAAYVAGLAFAEGSWFLLICNLALIAANLCLMCLQWRIISRAR